MSAAHASPTGSTPGAARRRGLAASRELPNVRCFGRLREELAQECRIVLGRVADIVAVLLHESPPSLLERVGSPLSVLDLGDEFRKLGALWGAAREVYIDTASESGAAVLKLREEIFEELRAVPRRIALGRHVAIEVGSPLVLSAFHLLDGLHTLHQRGVVDSAR